MIASSVKNERELYFQEGLTPAALGFMMGSKIEYFNTSILTKLIQYKRSRVCPAICQKNHVQDAPALTSLANCGRETDFRTGIPPARIPKKPWFPTGKWSASSLRLGKRTTGPHMLLAWKRELIGREEPTFSFFGDEWPAAGFRHTHTHAHDPWSLWEPCGHYLNATAAQTPHPDPAQAIPGLVAMVIGGQGFDNMSKRKVRHTFLYRNAGYFWGL